MSILPKIEVPHYTMVVPSTNEKVTYRPYLVKEEKVLMIALESSDPEQISSAMEHIIEVCVDTDTSALTSYDVEYLFLKLRSVSVGAKIEMYRGCDECDFKKNLVIVDLDKIEVRNKKEQEELRIELTDNVIVDINYPKTSANIDIYLFGLPIIIYRDLSLLNFSPLRGISGARFVNTSDELANSLRDAMQKRGHNNNNDTVFWMDKGLLKWKRLVSVINSVN